MFRLVVAAAAEYKDECQDDHPAAAIIKDVAKAVVVIHKSFLLKNGGTGPQGGKPLRGEDDTAVGYIRESRPLH